MVSITKTKDLAKETWRVDFLTQARYTWGTKADVVHEATARHYISIGSIARLFRTSQTIPV